MMFISYFQVNDLRFLPPQPIQPWSGIKPTTEFSSGCLNSLALIPDWLPVIPEDIKGDEDCLYINVHTPITNFDQIPHPSMPVIVSIFTLHHFNKKIRIFFIYIKIHEIFVCSIFSPPSHGPISNLSTLLERLHQCTWC